jgi:hypothetical protein
MPIADLERAWQAPFRTTVAADGGCPALPADGVLGAAAGDDTVILAENDSNGSKITV